MSTIEFIERIKLFWDTSTRRVLLFGAGAQGVAFLPTQTPMATADLILRCLQIGIAGMTLAYLTVKFYRFVVRPTNKQKHGEE